MGEGATGVGEEDAGMSEGADGTHNEGGERRVRQRMSGYGRPTDRTPCL
jgi:hypothetical protein